MTGRKERYISLRTTYRSRGAFPAFFLSLLLGASGSADELPLFATDVPLDVVLELPLNTILKQSAKRPVVAGQLHYSDSTGQQVTLDVKVTTRGNSRLEQCSFPPLSITVKKKQATDTLFAGQKKLKLVTHCQNRSSFGQYLLQEYSIYRAFNALTDISFRVRRLNISYRNTEKSGREIDADAFLIESIVEVSKRADLQRMKVDSVSARQLDPSYATISAVFQFLIGNTDWSIARGSRKNRCCHNGRVLSPADKETGWLVVPYDFDQAGLINTSYSQPNPTLPIRSVRQRLYRGRCAFADQLDAAIKLFNDRHSELESILLPAGLSGGKRKSSLAYIDEFYRIINDEERMQYYVDRGCMGPKL